MFPFSFIPVFFVAASFSEWAVSCLASDKTKEDWAKNKYYRMIETRQIAFGYPYRRGLNKIQGHTSLRSVWFFVCRNERIRACLI